MNIENTMIKENLTGSKYYVYDTDMDLNIIVQKDVVERINRRIPNLDPQQIALVVATVDKAKYKNKMDGKSSTIYFQRRTEEKEKFFCDSIICLLMEYEPETLSEIFEDMKHFQIAKVLRSETPNREIREFL